MDFWRIYFIKLSKFPSSPSLLNRIYLFILEMYVRLIKIDYSVVLNALTASIEIIFLL